MKWLIQGDRLNVKIDKTLEGLIRGKKTFNLSEDHKTSKSILFQSSITNINYQRDWKQTL